MKRALRQWWDWDSILLWAPVVGVAAATQAKLGLEEPWTGSVTGLTVTSLLQATPLLARRRWPLVTAGVIAAALPLQQALGGSLSFGTFVAVLVAAYAAGRHSSTVRTVAGAGVIFLGVVLATRDQLLDSAPELVFPFFYVTAAASVGVVVRRLSEQAAELNELNAALARERDTTTRLAAAGERMRLSRDLHDSVAHTLTVTVVQAENCEQAIDDDPSAAKSAAVAIQEVGRRGLSELRSVLRVLRDPMEPASEPVLADIGALATVVSESGLDVAVTTDGDPGRLPDDVGRQLYRVVQEALTNVIKHSAATSVTVEVVVDDEVAAVTVIDPGPAVNGGLSSGGYGTAVMAERLADHGGAVTAGPAGSGYRVHASAPLPVRAQP